jgi:hypothetical protein
MEGCMKLDDKKSCISINTISGGIVNFGGAVYISPITITKGSGSNDDNQDGASDSLLDTFSAIKPDFEGSNENTEAMNNLFSSTPDGPSDNIDFNDGLSNANSTSSDERIGDTNTVPWLSSDDRLDAHKFNNNVDGDA